jgi:hypothetical protein
MLALRRWPLGKVAGTLQTTDKSPRRPSTVTGGLMEEVF